MSKIANFFGSALLERLDPSSCKMAFLVRRILVPQLVARDTWLETFPGKARERSSFVLKKYQWQCLFLAAGKLSGFIFLGVSVALCKHNSTLGVVGTPATMTRTIVFGLSLPCGR